MFASISVGFGYVYYLRVNALGWFLAILTLLGFAGGNLAMYAVWLPEQYRTSCRATAFGFATSVGRFAAAGITFIVGWGVSKTGSIGMPVAWTSIGFLAGIVLLRWGTETAGQPLPE